MGAFSGAKSLQNSYIPNNYKQKLNNWKQKLIFWFQNGTFSKKQMVPFQTAVLCHLRALLNTFFHEIFYSFIWQEDSC